MTPASLHDQNPIIIQHCVQSMGYRHYSRPSHPLSDDPLYEGICFDIHIGGRLIQADNAAFPQ